MVLLAALGMGWLMDHRQLNARLRESELQMEIQGRVVAALKEQLKFRSGSMQTLYFWASADEFIEELKFNTDEDSFLDKAPSLSRANEVVFDEAVRQVIGLLKDENETTKQRSITTLRFLQTSVPGRLERHADAAVTEMLPLLDDPSEVVVFTTIFALQQFGPAARPALDGLRKRMDDNGDHCAPFAAIAIAHIDPSIEIGPRLIELVKLKHPSWYTAACHLSEYVPSTVARQVLTELYDGMKTEAERNALTQAMTRIPP
jgi:hypothetical protein